MSYNLTALRHSIDLLELCAVELRRVSRREGGEYAGPCPFCGGEDRFHVQPYREQGGRWFCRQCTGEPSLSGWKDLFDFVMRKERCSFGQAVGWLERRNYSAPRVTSMAMAKRKSKPPPLHWSQPDWQRAAKRLVQQGMNRLLWECSGLAGRRYLHRRGIDAQSSEAWRLGVANVWHPKHQRTLDAILLPWLDGENTSAVQYRFIDPSLTKAERFGQKAGGQRLLFGLQRLAAQPTLLLVEGELNAVSLWQSCRDLGVDVLSWGPQGNLLWPPVTQLAMQVMQPYQQVLLWADEVEMVHKLHTHLRHKGVTLPTILTTASPLGRDANDLLLRGELRDYVQQVLRL